MKPSEVDQDGLAQLLSSLTAEEHAAMKQEGQEIAGRYKELPPEEAARLRRRDLSALVMEAIGRVMGGTAKPQ
jgi:hypothetical protein